LGANAKSHFVKKNKAENKPYSENEFMTQTNETCMIADQTRTLKAGITSI
jgi:hypothetical protein